MDNNYKCMQLKYLGNSLSKNTPLIMRFVTSY